MSAPKGITSLKTLISFVILTAQEISTLDADKNKKVSLLEAFKAIYEIGPKIPGVYNNMPEVVEEWKDLTQEELKELVQYFVDTFDLPGIENGKIETIIKKTASMLVYNYNYYRDLKTLLA